MGNGRGDLLAGCCCFVRVDPSDAPLAYLLVNKKRVKRLIEQLEAFTGAQQPVIPDPVNAERVETPKRNHEGHPGLVNSAAEDHLKKWKGRGEPKTPGNERERER